MISVVDNFYCAVRKKEIIRLKKIINNLKVDTFYLSLTKGCWKFGIQHEILLKNAGVLEIKLYRGRKALIIKFHKTATVFMGDYERFLDMLKRHGINKGVYITSGVFEQKIINSYRRRLRSDNKVKLEDMTRFGRGQLGWSRRSEEILKEKTLKLYKYLS
ncbi:hypothetical protein [Clostridium thermarum]|uniref:hypothetical protein n=1 Tax=Clostridium thermarum TaxID=1716543 RepID=UPI00111E6E10|nr:hypothetical protein [Clostridium thermarum]